MAHVGEEFAFGAVGGFGYVLGLLKDGVSLTNLLDHAVEAIDEIADFVVMLFKNHDAGGVVARGGNRTGGGGQPEDGFGDGALQP